MAIGILLSICFNKFLSMPLGSLYQNPRPNPATNQKSAKNALKRAATNAQIFLIPVLIRRFMHRPARPQRGHIP
jgi:hypothetical protein